MVKEQPSDRLGRSTRTLLKKLNSRPTQRNPHLASRGRPRKQRMGTSPFQIQKQFTQQFIQFGKQYLQWKLNDSYVWSNDFDRRDPQAIQKLPIENPVHQQAITNIVSNMCNMMEVEVGRQFRQCCIDAYNACRKKEGLEKTQERLVDMVMNSEKYAYLGLRHSEILKERKYVKGEIIIKFVESIVELMYKIGQKEEKEKEKMKE